MSTIADLKSKLSANYERLLAFDAARSAALKAFEALSPEEKAKSVENIDGYWKASIDALYASNLLCLKNERLRQELYELEVEVAIRGGSELPSPLVTRTKGFMW